MILPESGQNKPRVKIRIHSCPETVDSVHGFVHNMNMNKSSNTPSTQSSTDQTFDLTRNLIESLTTQLKLSDCYGNNLSDDACDDLDMTMTILNRCTDALIDDDRANACDTLQSDLKTDDDLMHCLEMIPFWGTH